MNKITQTARYRQALIQFAQKHGVTKAAVRYHTNCQYIYRWVKLQARGYTRSISGLYRFLRKRNAMAEELPNPKKYTPKPYEQMQYPGQGKDPKPTVFEQTLAQLGIRHKLIKAYTPRHNGKVERSHRKDNEEFYASHRFFSFDDFKKQLSVRERSYNHFPIRPLNWNSPAYVLKAFPNM